MFRDECGVMAAYSGDASSLAYLGLYALQHRGQEACGIVSLDDSAGEPQVHEHKAFGLVADAFSEETLNRLPGRVALGHVRYSTQGGRSMHNVQPLVFRTPAFGPVAIAHNGNFTNASRLRQELETTGSVIASTSDSELFVHLLARSRGKELVDRVFEALSRLRGAYALVLAVRDRIFGIRDSHAFRPLVVGRRDGAWFLASESCALDLIDAKVVREVAPGEVVELSTEGLKSHHPFPRTSSHACAFEPIYFSRPDSGIAGQTIYECRRQIGEALAREAPADADIVFPVPDSGVPMAVGFAAAAGIPFEMGLIRNHYVGRTFIQPTHDIRDFAVKVKLNPIRAVIKGQRVVVIDDSIVRGTTVRKIVALIRDAGARAIHLRIGSPAITHPCFYGVATPTREQLLAARLRTAEIQRELEVESLAYLSLPGLRQVLRAFGRGFCYACFTGSYPEEVEDAAVAGQKA